jgi:outer membrane scaffolding protein for murein synthesis (MipA/OmpV family)
VPPYAAGAGINAHVRLMLSYQISRRWNFSLAAEYERLNDEAAASPLVDAEDVVGYFAGFGFRFR